MKTSIIIFAALLLNTTLLIAEPLSVFVKSIHPAVLMGTEAFLVLGYYINSWLKELRKECSIDLGNLDIYVVKSR